ncbi:MAG: hypothetical protein HKO54_03320, partial [Flavobacteriaceae bacterium]|nr:hypothetical protein [Flavobacteriaceae bacterium]
SYLTSGTGIASNGENGLFAYGRTATGTGVIGSGNNGSIFTLTSGSGVAGTGIEIGVFGLATITTDTGFGGYFENDGSYAYVGGWFLSPPPGPPTWTEYKILGSGTVSTIVKDTNENPVIMFAPEAPEILFQDYGIGQLVNGSVYVSLDPVLRKNIRVDSEHPLKVFVQLEGDCNGVYVTNKSANGFMVNELQGGTSNVSFAWSIVATRADAQSVGRSGETRISNNGVRFPPAPQSRISEQLQPVVNTQFDLKKSIKSKQ